MFDEPVEGAQIGFIGLGDMGYPISQCIREAGFPVTAFDIRDDVLTEFEATGGTSRESPAAVGRASRGVHIAVVTDDQAKDVVYGEGGVFAGFEASDGGVLVVHSTLRPETVEDFAANAPANVAVIDAAMSGGSERAAEGDLAIMVGGDEAIVEYYRPVLEPIAREVFFLGDTGAGLATKLANNLAYHVTMAGTLEAIELGEAYGVDEDDLLAVFEQSTGDNYFVRNYDFFTREYLETHPAGPYAMARNSKKNLTQALELGDDVGTGLPMAGITSQLLPETYEDIADELVANDDP